MQDTTEWWYSYESREIGPHNKLYFNRISETCCNNFAVSNKFQYHLLIAIDKVDYCCIYASLYFKMSTEFKVGDLVW